MFPLCRFQGSIGYRLSVGIACLALLAGAELHTAQAVTGHVARPSQNDNGLVVEMMQTGRGDTSSEVRDALVFRVRAFDPRVGNRDGAGIRNVDMIILDEDGRQVYRKRESSAGYCAFGGGEPNCAVYDFEDNANEWPNGEEILDGGEYTLVAVVNARDGRRTRMDTQVVIDLRDDAGSNSDDAGLFGEVMQTGMSGDDNVVEDALVFRVRASDRGEGGDDGEGIRNVDMIILDDNGREVYRKRENNAGYCAFGGGEPNCAVYDFEDNDYEWPNGESIRRGEEYTLRAVINADDGRRMTVDRVVEIR